MTGNEWVSFTGWLYLAGVIELANWKIDGWLFSINMTVEKHTSIVVLQIALKKGYSAIYIRTLPLQKSTFRIRRLLTIGSHVEKDKPTA